MGEVVNLDTICKLPIPVERILKEALDAGMTQVVVVGFDKDGGEYFASSEPDGGTVLWHLERAKHNLMKITDQLQE